MATRWVVVDDTSTDINYIGSSWFANVGSQDAAGNFGPPFMFTLHGTNTSASLTFSFIGSEVKVMGANNIRNDSGVIDPEWSCYVDGIGIDSTSPGPFQYPENNWVFCHSYSLTDGSHTLTVNATVAKSQTFWLDSIVYAPSTSVSLANKTIMVTSPDPAMQFGSGWSDYAEIGNLTQTQGSLFALNFYGTSLSWYGDIPAEWSGNSTTATWAIDNNPAQVFLLNGHGANAVTEYNQKLFDTAVYPFGSHMLTVTYNGDTSKTPLVLGSLVIQNNTVATGSSTGSVSGIHTPLASSMGSVSSATPLASSTVRSSSASTHTTSAIIGGVIGASVCLLVVVALVLYRRRRKSNKELDTVAPIEYTPVNHGAYNHPLNLPSKVRERHSSSLNFRSSGHSRNPSNSLSDSTGLAAGPSTFVIHQDSGARLPGVTRRPQIDIPPQYTQD